MGNTWLAQTDRGRLEFSLNGFQNKGIGFHDMPFLGLLVSQEIAANKASFGPTKTETST